jgi:PilZ domain
VAGFGNKRQFERSFVSVKAFVEILGRPRISCYVRNISEGGALIDIIDHVGLPRTFGLQLETSSVVIECELTHATKNNYGVAFKMPEGIVGTAMKRAIRRTQDALHG